VNIPYRRGLLGHSDADVLVHAVMDALLGASGLGDIGQLFPDSDPKYEGADSMALLSEVAVRVRSAGFQVVNVDATIVAQLPRLAPHIPVMRENLARVLALDVSCVNVKATTEEGLGYTGSGEGISAMAVALLT
jgi:2-C-methyl-D-erythritol 2,4-cyclodiphosphate synthase